MKKTALDIKNLPKEKSTRALAKVIHHALEEMKAGNILFINVKDISSVTDVMVIASGTSSRHVKSISDTVVENCKKQGFKVIGVEGQDSCEWVLVDVGDILVHIMQENARKFYELEKLWDHQEVKNEIKSSVKSEAVIETKKRKATKSKEKTKSTTKPKNKPRAKKQVK
jgi:ribosome-associated protein